MKGITWNIEMKCIMARVMRLGKRHQRNFTLHQYGTYEAAERAAKRWNSGMHKVLPPPTTTKGIITARNSSGVVGVKICRDVRKKNGCEYVSWKWLAFWPQCRFSGGLGWSINKHGDNDAFVLAVLSRRYEIIDRNILLKELDRISAKDEYQEILALKNLSPSE